MILIPIVLGLYVGLPFSIGYAVARWWVVGALGVVAAVVVISDTADWVRVAPVYACWYALCAGLGVALRTTQKERRLRAVASASMTNESASSS